MMQEKFKTAYRVLRFKYRICDWRGMEFVTEFAEKKNEIYKKALTCIAEWHYERDDADPLYLSWQQLRDYGYIETFIRDETGGRIVQLPFSSYGKRTKDFKLNLPEWF